MAVMRVDPSNMAGMAHAPGPADTLLMGPQSTQLNLRSVRVRAEELRRTIDQLLHTLQFAPASLQWWAPFALTQISNTHFDRSLPHPTPPPSFPSRCRSDALDKFAVLNVQLQHMETQLRPLLQHYVVHPRSVNQTNAPVLPIMLATKLLPEQEAEREAALAGDAAAVAAAAAEGIAALNAAVEAVAQAGGLLDARGSRRRQLTAAVKAAAEPRSAGVGLEASHAPGPAAPPPDVLLAAVSYGAGLRATS